MSRVTIKELRLRNYRAFVDARLVLDDVTFLVGRNGAGKSTLMDAFSFVSEAVTDSLGTALERRDGLLGLLPKHLRHGNEGRRGISVAICFERNDESPIVYGFRVGPRQVVKQEILRGDGVPSFERDEDGFRSTIASLHPDFDPGALALPLIAGSNETWKTIIESLRLISMHQFSPQAIRSEPKIGKDRRLNRDGQNAGDILKLLKPKDKKWIETWLAAAVPGLKDVSVDTVVGRRVIGFAQTGNGGGVEMFDASAMSDGTLRSLGILLALRQSSRPSIVLLDEIEDSLHPYAHGVLLDAIEAASEEFPVVVSTHSPEILTQPAARGERIRVIQWSEGQSRIYELSENVQENLKPPLTVGQLLRANALWTEEEPSTIGAEADFFKLP
jgi:predicted ATPase